jgi:hypothetical protein
MPLTKPINRMRNATQSTAVILILTFLISCSKKDDHEPRQSCVFTGKTSTRISQTSKSEWGNEILLDEKKQLISAKRIDNLESFDRWKSTKTVEYVPQFNADGLLVRMVVTTSDLYEGTKGYSYQYNYQHYLKFRTETTETSEYQYESGRATTIITKTVVRAQGDNSAPIVQESEQIKKYTYDSQNVVVSALTTTPTGSIISTFKNGVIASEISKNKGGVVDMESHYNDKGLRTSIKSGNFFYEFEFDSNGNQKSVKFTQDGQLNYLQEFTYDDHENPETHIPVKFKGIPEDIPTVKSTEGVNNMTGEKFTSYKGGSNYDVQFIYQYNANGLPDSWTQNSVPAGETAITSFRYKCP